MSSKGAAMTEVQFILEEALKLDSRIGTDGEDVMVLYPRTKLPRETYQYFSRAIGKHRDEIVAHILAEQKPCPTM
jgi:hypothetical protein